LPAFINQPNHAVDATCHSGNAIGLNPITDQETVMSKLYHAGAITLAIISGVGVAVAQRAPSDLTPTQQRTVSQGLASSPSQSAPAAQPQVGDKLPDSMTAQSMPNNVADQVPEAKQLLFVKLPDRIILIDPDTKLVSEIVMDSDSATTGSIPIVQTDLPGRF
jgi:hypothetical protein